MECIIEIKDSLKLSKPETNIRRVLERVLLESTYLGHKGGIYLRVSKPHFTALVNHPSVSELVSKRQLITADSRLGTSVTLFGVTFILTEGDDSAGTVNYTTVVHKDSGATVKMTLEISD